MALVEYSKRLLALAKTLHRWIERLEGDPENPAARRWMLREFGRIRGYIETIVETLDDHLDGRKLAGVKRRLEQLELSGLEDVLDLEAAHRRIDRLVSSEGYFRGLGDALRV